MFHFIKVNFYRYLQWPIFVDNSRELQPPSTKLLDNLNIVEKVQFSWEHTGNVP